MCLYLGGSSQHVASLYTGMLLLELIHGFRAGHSCETQLILAIDDWAKTIYRGSQTDVAIFDFSNAFDSVPHKRLLAKLEYDYEFYV